MNGEQDLIKLMQNHQLAILRQFKRVCDNNGIAFYLAFGSALGARRHKGFIPWDDDIDVYMKVEDLSRFERIKNQLPDNLFFQTRSTDPEFGLLIARIRDSNTTLIEEDHFSRDINQGVYMDIYPLFNVPESSFGRKALQMESLICRLFAYDSPPANKGCLITSISKLMLKLFPKRLKRKLADTLYQWITKSRSSAFLSNFPDVSLGAYYKAEWFKEPSQELFEGEMMPVPTDNGGYLSHYYGEYMKLPPVEMRKIHHNYLFYDFDTPYIKYKGIQYCTNYQAGE